MNISEFKKYLPVLMNNNIPPFVWGNPGIGKTQAVKQVAKELGIGCFVLNLATQDVGDLVGLLVHDPATGTVYHAKPKWWPAEGTRGILFLDEANRAHPEVQQALYPMMTSRTLHTHILPDGWAIVLAGNYNNERHNVTDMSDDAWVSRFCQIDLKPTVQEFISYAESVGADTVASFITEHPQMLETNFKDSNDFFVKPDRRSYIEMINLLEREEMPETVRYELYTGIIGVTATAAFFAHKKQAGRAIKLKDIVKDYSKVKSRVTAANRKDSTSFDVLAAPIEELTLTLEQKPDFLTEQKVVQLKEFLLDIPLELLFKTCTKLSTLTFGFKDSVLNDPVFVKRISNRATNAA